MIKLKLVSLTGGNNFYTLPTHKNKLMESEQIKPYVHDYDYVLIDEDAYNRLQGGEMLNSDDFKHLIHFNSKLGAKTYVNQQYEQREYLDDNTFLVGNLKEGYRAIDRLSKR